jgi:hypothetical protein
MSKNSKSKVSGASGHSRKSKSSGSAHCAVSSEVAPTPTVAPVTAVVECSAVECPTAAEPSTEPPTVTVTPPLDPGPPPPATPLATPVAEPDLFRAHPEFEHPVFTLWDHEEERLMIVRRPYIFSALTVYAKRYSGNTQLRILDFKPTRDSVSSATKEQDIVHVSARTYEAQIIPYKVAQRQRLYLCCRPPVFDAPDGSPTHYFLMWFGPKVASTPDQEMQATPSLSDLRVVLRLDDQLLDVPIVLSPHMSKQEVMTNIQSAVAGDQLGAASHKRARCDEHVDELLPTAKRVN